MASFAGDIYDAHNQFEYATKGVEKKMSVLYIRNESGDFVPIYTIKGDKGDKGDAGSVTAVNGLSPDGSGNVTLVAADVGALAAGGTAADASKLGGKSASEYALKTDTAPDSSKLGGKTLAEIMLALYPVGAVYISANSTSPASLFGGTWEQLQDRFLLAAGSTYSAGSTGGEATHTLTVDEMPSHVHSAVTRTSAGNYQGYFATTSNTTDTIGDIKTKSAGGDAAHNNMPPYLAVYMWKRVS